MTPSGMIKQRAESTLDFSSYVSLTQVNDKSLTDLDNLPEPEELAEEIIENLEVGLNSFRNVLARLEKAS